LTTSSGLSMPRYWTARSPRCAQRYSGYCATESLRTCSTGVWLGHPLYPALAQFALGSFTSASLIDATGGRRAESSGLIALGLVRTVPTIAAGWAESHEDQQRVGLVHAAINATAVAAFATALLQRYRNRGSGRLLSLAGGTLSAVGAALGGHLAYRQATGANHGEEIPHTGPGDWQSLGPMCDIPTDPTGTQDRRRCPRSCPTPQQGPFRVHRALQPLPPPFRPTASRPTLHDQRRALHHLPLAR
jgi:uncharacterized membrane protein